MNGSFIVFMTMLIASMFLGRVWCGYLCPAGGMQECAMRVNDTTSRQGVRNYIKYVIWIVWIITVIATFIMGKNDVTIDFFYMTDHGISIAEVYNYITYYGVIGLLVVPCLIHGRRSTCHYICWMAPFMVIGSKLGQLLHLPQLHVEADKSKCISCKVCNRSCPMSLDVEKMVSEGSNVKCSECILCGECVDACPKKVLRYSWKWSNKK